MIDTETLQTRLLAARSSRRRLILARELARIDQYANLAHEWAAQVRDRIRYRGTWERRVGDHWRPLSEPALLSLLARHLKPRRRYGRLATVKERDLRGVLSFAEVSLLEPDGEDPFAGDDDR